MSDMEQAARRLSDSVSRLEKAIERLAASDSLHDERDMADMPELAASLDKAIHRLRALLEQPSPPAGEEP